MDLVCSLSAVAATVLLQITAPLPVGPEIPQNQNVNVVNPGSPEVQTKKVEVQDITPCTPPPCC